MSRVLQHHGFSTYDAFAKALNRLADTIMFFRGYAWGLPSDAYMATKAKLFFQQVPAVSPPRPIGATMSLSLDEYIEAQRHLLGQDPYLWYSHLLQWSVPPDSPVHLHAVDVHPGNVGDVDVFANQRNCPASAR